MPHGLVSQGSSHRLTLQGTGGGGRNARRHESARVSAGAQGSHLTPPSPGWTQPGPLESQAWRLWREAWQWAGWPVGHDGQVLWTVWTGALAPGGMDKQARSAAGLELGKRSEGPGGRRSPAAPAASCLHRAARQPTQQGERSARGFRAMWQGPESHALHCPRPPPPAVVQQGLPSDLDPAGLALRAGGAVLPIVPSCPLASEPVSPTALILVSSAHHGSSWPP